MVSRRGITRQQRRTPGRGPRRPAYGRVRPGHGSLIRSLLVIPICLLVFVQFMPAVASASPKPKHLRLHSWHGKTIKLNAAAVSSPGPTVPAPVVADLQPVPAPDITQYAFKVTPYVSTSPPPSTSPSPTLSASPSPTLSASPSPTLSASPSSGALAPVPLAGSNCSDPPPAPTLSGPGNTNSGSPQFLDAPTPVLKLATPYPCDSDGETVLFDYQVFNAANNNRVFDSGWTSETSIPIAAGVLFDGQSYYWWAQSVDVNSNYVQQHNPKQSGTLYITISGRHTGFDKRYMMWSHSVGNNINIRVNDSNGNLFTRVPLGKLSTVAGWLRWGISYNSLDYGNHGLGQGWRVYAGSDSSGGTIPVQVTEDTNADTFKLVTENGNRDYFSHVAGPLYTDGQGGMIHKNCDLGTSCTGASLVYTAPSGDTYTFDTNGTMTSERVSVARDVTNAGSGTDFTYSFTMHGTGSSAYPMIQSVTSPVNSNRKLVFSWSSGQLQNIKDKVDPAGDTVDTWSFNYNANGQVSSVAVTSSTNVPFNGSDPAFPASGGQTRTIHFGYKNFSHNQDTQTLLTQIENGDQTQALGGLSCTSDPSVQNYWQICYAYDSGAPQDNNGAFTYRAMNITAPPNGSSSPDSHWDWTYTDFSSANSNLGPSTTVHDDVMSSPSGSQTQTWFNYAGLPIEQKGPQITTNIYGLSYQNTTTWAWDTNDNLLCHADPIANAYWLANSHSDLLCTIDSNGNPRYGNGQTTAYTYSPNAPYSETSVTYPAPNPDGTGTQRASTFTYDGGSSFQGLWDAQFTNKNSTGIPVHEGVWSQFNWSGGIPTYVQGANAYAVRWTGLLTIPTQDKYYFKFSFASPLGGQLSVGNSTLFGCLANGATAAFNCDGSTISKSLHAGQVPITIQINDPNPTTNNSTWNFQWNEGSNGNYATIDAAKTDPNQALQTKEITGPLNINNPNGLPQIQTATTYSNDFAMSRRLADSVTTEDLNTTNPSNTARTTSYTYYHSTGLVNTKTLPDPAGNGSNMQPTYTYTYSGNNDGCVTEADLSSGNQTFVTASSCDQLGFPKTKVQTAESVNGIVSGTQVQGAYSVETDYYYNDFGQLLGQSTPYVLGTSCAGTTIPSGGLRGTWSQCVPVSITQYDQAGYKVETDSPLTQSSSAGTYASTFYTYWASGDLSCEEIPASGAASENWTSATPCVTGLPTTNGGTILFGYDLSGNLNSKTQAFESGNGAVTSTWTASYDPMDRMSSSTQSGSGSNTYQTSYYYEQQDPTYSSSNPSSNLWGATSVVEKPNGVTSVSRTNMDGLTNSTSTWLVSSSGLSATATQGPTAYGYDVLGNQNSISDGDGVTETKTYGSFGEMTQDVKPAPTSSGSSTATWTYKYNALGQMYVENGPGAQKNSYFHDLAGNVCSVDQVGIDPSPPASLDCKYADSASPATYLFRYDDLGNLIETTSPLASGNSSSAYSDRTYLYFPSGSNGQPAPQTAPLLQMQVIGTGSDTPAATTTYTYGTVQSVLIAKPTSVADPRSNTITNVYDNYGNLTHHYYGSTSNDQTFTYNQLGSQLSANETGGVTTSFVYNSDSTPASVTSNSLTTTYSYYGPGSFPSTDAADLHTIADPATTTAYTWDGAGRLSTVTSPLNSAVSTYSYDQAGRMTQRQDTKSGLATITWIRCYDLGGTGGSNSGALTAQYVSDGSNGTPSCASSQATNEAAATIAYSEYTSYDVLANVLSDKEHISSGPANGTWAYTYDAAERLASQTPPSGATWPAQTFTYDGSGNRITVADTTSYSGSGTCAAPTNSACNTSYNSRGLPYKYVSGSSTTYYCYDKAGNMTLEGSTSQGSDQTGCSGAASSTQAFTYDEWNRMSGASTKGSTTMTYGYSFDALSRLVQTTGGANTINLYYQGASNNVAKETAGSTATTFAYTAYGPLAQSSGTPAYFVKDPHGDVTALATPGSSSVVLSGQTSYSPWGEVVTGSTSASILGFQGQVTDAGTGFVKTSTRFYDPSQGRFTAQDSLFGSAIDPMSLNQYAYGNDSPVLFGDLSGMSPDCRRTSHCSDSDPTGTEDAGGNGGGNGQGPVSWCQQDCQATPAEPAPDIWAWNGENGVATGALVLNLAVSGHLGSSVIVAATYDPRCDCVAMTSSSGRTLSLSGISNSMEFFGPLFPARIAGFRGGTFYNLPPGTGPVSSIGWNPDQFIAFGSRALPGGALALSGIRGSPSSSLYASRFDLTVTGWANSAGGSFSVRLGDVATGVGTLGQNGPPANDEEWRFITGAQAGYSLYLSGYNTTNGINPAQEQPGPPIDEQPRQ